MCRNNQHWKREFAFVANFSRGGMAAASLTNAVGRKNVAASKKARQAGDLSTLDLGWVQIPERGRS